MDATEKHVHDYLVHRGFANITYEPDGNVPPDFLVNGNIAIEVRRLNQNYFDVGGAKGLEEDAIPLWHKIKQLLSDPGPPVRGESWFVHFRFSRPLQPWKTVEPTLLAGLQSFMASAMHERKVVARLPRFELEVSCRASEAHETMFLLGGCSDQESGLTS
jgi:hypothetical protein